LSYILTIFFCCTILAIIYHYYYKEKIAAFKFLLFVYCSKIIVGCLYGFYFSKVPFEADTWKYFNEAIVEYDWLKKDPTAFVKDLVTHGYKNPQYDTFFKSENSYWKNLSNNVLIKLLACIQIIAQKNYYATVSLFSFLTLPAPFYIWKIVKKNIEVNWFKYLVFFWPPVLFFTCGIHKDGIMFTCLAACIYYFLKTIETKKIQHILLFTTFILLLFILRNFIAVTLIFTGASFLVYYAFRLSFYQFFLVFICMLFVVFFISIQLPSSFNILFILNNKRNSFLALKGNSLIDSIALQPTLASFGKYFFKSLRNVLIEPNFFSYNGLVGLCAAFSNCLLLLLFIGNIFITIKKAITLQPIWLLLLPFCFLNYLIIGYTVPFSGAIIRYKTMFEFLLILFLVERIYTYCTNKFLYKL
jgi:hypothetical protein